MIEPTLIRTNQLNAEQLEQLDQLCYQCKQEDDNVIAIYKHIISQKRPTPCNLLYYQKEQLIGFLSTFFFHLEACEIALMVAPLFRKQGLATQLIREALPAIQAKKTKNIVFSTTCVIDNHGLTARGFRYQNSEYQMQLQQKTPVVAEGKSLTIRHASLADIPALCAIDSACFPPQYANMESRFHTLLTNPEYTLFLALKDDIPIGKAHLSQHPEGIRIADMAIIPRLQGRGFGCALLAYCINYALTAKPKSIVLEVETNNQNALRLYTRLGFVVNNAYDFWTIPFDELKDLSSKANLIK